MKTHVFLALFALFCYTTAKEWPTGHEEPGYTARERASMNKLVADAVEPKDWLTQLTERNR